MYVLMTLFASAMWGSWMQSTKHLDDFPIPAFVILVYTSSFLLVWSVLLIFKSFFVPMGILNELSGKLPLAFGVIISGALMAVGLLISLTTINKVGIILVTSISSGVSTTLGLLISMALGGLPKTISVLFVLAALFIMLIAGFLCQYAGVLRNKDYGKVQRIKTESNKYIAYVVFANILISMYVVGFSIGTRTSLNPQGFAPLLCVALLALGSLIGAVISSTIILIRSKNFFKMFEAKYNTQRLLGLGSGLFHYGGNILNIISIPFLSAPISFLIGKTSDFWSYSWGLFYGEFTDSSRKTMLVLYSGFLMYIIGIIVLIYGLYF